MADLEEFAARAQTVARQSAIDRAAAEAVAALQKAGIEPLLLKGPVLARTLYRPDERRGYFDIDLLVAPDQREAAGAALSQLGYIDFVSTARLRAFADDPHADLWTRGTDQGMLAIDLHWRLPGCGAAPQQVWELLHERRASLEITHVRIPVPDRPALALHLALHAAQHGPDDRKALGDLDRGVERWPLQVWSEARELATAAGASDTLAAGLRLSTPGAALADDLGLRAADDLLRAIHGRRLRPRGASNLQAFADATGARQKLAVLRWSLLPERRWIVRAYPWARGSRVRLAGAYALQLCRAPFWALRAWLFERR